MGKALKQNRYSNYFNDIMHQSTICLAETKEENITQKEETIAEEELPKTELETTLPSPVAPTEREQMVCTNDYTCTCEKCQNEFGGLPILLQGIEIIKSKEQRLDTQPTTSSGVDSNLLESSLPKKCLSCPYCYKTFHHKGDYNKHLRKHTKEKPFTCTVCDKKFSHTSNLQRHVRLHSGQKPYTCKICQKSFSRKDKLNSHKNSRLCQKRANNSS